jgi:hypothetical protein
MTDLQLANLDSGHLSLEALNDVVNVSGHTLMPSISDPPLVNAQHGDKA